MKRAAAMIALGLASCAPAAVDEPRNDRAAGDVASAPELDIDLAALALVDDGPFASTEGAPVVGCVDGGVALESGRAEVRTQWCDPADLAVQLERDVSAGEVLEVTLSHEPLFADGGEAHLAIVVGDEVVWELTKALPAPAEFMVETAAIASAHRAGERLVVHVHNHGANSYSIHRVVIGR